MKFQSTTNSPIGKRFVILVASLLCGLFLINHRVSAATLEAPANTTTVLFESKVSPVKIISSNELLKREYADLRAKRQLENEQVITNLNSEEK
ncbi:hypothetical protein [Limosilactobacillus reuteri]|uniref:hypothetical protein n=1 Tax=Limosilactobacillus reuteri TaxID=1598 RepID=UPI00214B4C74|nr:hypothetical protein [Limosilactobacillus reuteri]MCR1863984.1 hypothetical protein [Limosilactobacillus reuteri]MCR1893760.1 hypothetical protein [Limosilactobacillus reuteri]